MALRVLLGDPAEESRQQADFFAHARIHPDGLRLVNFTVFIQCQQMLDDRIEHPVAQVKFAVHDDTDPVGVEVETDNDLIRMRLRIGDHVFFGVREGRIVVAGRIGQTAVLVVRIAFGADDARDVLVTDKFFTDVAIIDGRTAVEVQRDLQSGRRNGLPQSLVFIAQGCIVGFTRTCACFGGCIQRSRFLGLQVLAFQDLLFDGRQHVPVKRDAADIRLHPVGPDLDVAAGDVKSSLRAERANTLVQLTGDDRLLALLRTAEVDDIDPGFH